MKLDRVATPLTTRRQGSFHHVGARLTLARREPVSAAEGIEEDVAPSGEHGPEFIGMAVVADIRLEPWGVAAAVVEKHRWEGASAPWLPEHRAERQRPTPYDDRVGPGDTLPPGRFGEGAGHREQEEPGGRHRHRSLARRPISRSVADHHPRRIDRPDEAPMSKRTSRSACSNMGTSARLPGLP